MTKTKDMTNGSDFAFSDKATQLLQSSPNGIRAYNPPLTKREYFAARALQGLLAHYGSDYESVYVRDSVVIADALIKALNND